MNLTDTAEGKRLSENAAGNRGWYRWGPYLSERQWGTVREDYSTSGDAWAYLPHELARSRAYRWGEDGLAGISDDRQRLCLALALWNGRDPILKERLFGLTNAEGNHGEDVKEYYYYLDATPSHAYLKMLYRYPQHAYPYEDLVRQNSVRGRAEPEYELVDTGIFEENRYFDAIVEYAKADTDDILMKVSVTNCGADSAPIWILPQLWFRNTWSWEEGVSKPLLIGEPRQITATHSELGHMSLHFETPTQVLFTENESRILAESTHGNAPYAKDAFHRYLVDHDHTGVNAANRGTKAGVLFKIDVCAGKTSAIRLRLTAGATDHPFRDHDAIFETRRAEANEFYEALQREIMDREKKLIQRQALAGMIWSKQWYHYDVGLWITGDEGKPRPPVERQRGRNADWLHLTADDIVSMPDKWEYPWFAVWDLAFHCIPLALVDAQFAKQQLMLFTGGSYMHPSGQLPAYEWDFGDANPPVHAWACWRVFQIDRKQRGDDGDLAFLEGVFHKLMLNFAWWVNRKDIEGRNVFQGGFLGLDNIGVFDRSQPLPTGGHINQADGTSWMAMYSLNLMRIALELALHNHVYEDIAAKFFEHFLYIAAAMTNMRGADIGLWDEQDEFYYDELILPEADGRLHYSPLRVRSLVGIIPLFAVETIEPETMQELPGFAERLDWLLTNRPKLAALVSHWHEPGRGSRRLLSLLRGHRMKRLLARMLDPNEFLSDFGVRSLSKFHLQNPYGFDHAGRRYEVRYTPAESDSWMFGGNSNWRGPIWLPINYLIVESLQKFHHYYGDEFKIELPTGSGEFVSILEVANDLTRRLINLYLPDAEGRRAAFGDCRLHRKASFVEDALLFYEYFDGDSGRGVGASHQTGWTGLLAKLLQPRE